MRGLKGLRDGYGGDRDKYREDCVKDAIDSLDDEFKPKEEEKDTVEPNANTDDLDSKIDP